MNILLWVIAATLATVFLGSGAVKLVVPEGKIREQSRAQGMAWVEKVPVIWIRTLGAIEVLGAIGLILPAVLDIAPILVPLAAVGAVLVMLGAVAVHQSQRDWPGVAMTTAFLIAGVFVAWGRFGPYSFTS